MLCGLSTLIRLLSRFTALVFVGCFSCAHVALVKVVSPQPIQPTRIEERRAGHEPSSVLVQSTEDSAPPTIHPQVTTSAEAPVTIGGVMPSSDLEQPSSDFPRGRALSILKQPPVERARAYVRLRARNDKVLTKLNLDHPTVRGVPPSSVLFPFEIEGITVYNAVVFLQPDGFDSIVIPSAASLPISMGPTGKMPKDKTGLVFARWHGELRLVRIEYLNRGTTSEMVEWIDPYTQEVLLSRSTAHYSIPMLPASKP